MKRLEKEKKELLFAGTVFPAHPLCLDANRQLDEDGQRLLTNYYIASGAGGIAVGVHSTQFEIRLPEFDLLEDVLRITAEVVEEAQLDRPFIKIAGLVGPTDQAIREAQLAVSYGYDMGLLSMGGLHELTEDEILDRTAQVAKIIPVFGFYLQPSVGGRIFSYDFWSKFVNIPNVEAIKCASFNRYQTLDVVRAIANSDRSDDIALYTGNDDNIIADLISVNKFTVNGEEKVVQFRGGLLGHWAVWTSKAVELMKLVKDYKLNPTVEKWTYLQELNGQTTDANAALFDVAHDFHGCIPGIHEVLHRQGLMKGIWCLNPNEVLSEGQAEELTRIQHDYPGLNDDDFVSDFLKSQLVNHP
ncbi:dihydrodipicolinate synthase family protein [Sphingobacterium kyonggiense]|uniref:Dihydrodipicolinate synthase family protein n=1 Tax=Sphingobacterium kyonggiense TaxID=714075 RepID=A0ABP7Y6X9_9SPHI